jgi:hypothetical protein
VAASQAALPEGKGWQVYTGYVRGHAGAGATGTGGTAPSMHAPGVMHASTRYVSPILYLNFGSGSSGANTASGIQQVDMVSVEAMTVGPVTTSHLMAGAVTSPTIAAGAVTARELAAASVTAEKLTVAGGSNILTDPGFEGPATAARAAKTTWAVQDLAFGNGSLGSLKIDATSTTAATQAVQIGELPVTGGDKYFLGVDYYVAPTWDGTEVNVQVRCETAAGVFGYAKLTAAPPVKGAWTRLSGAVTIPAGAWVKGIVRVESGQATVGAVWFDNAELRPIVGAVQIADGAVTARHVLSGSITTDKLAAKAITADKLATNSITTEKIDTYAITGKVITGGTVTGATVQTSEDGQGVELGYSNTFQGGIIKFPSGSPHEFIPAFMTASTVQDEGVTVAELNLWGPVLDDNVTNLSALTMTAKASGDETTLTTSGELWLNGDASVDIRSEGEVNINGVSVSAKGVLDARNEASGVVRIVPTANVPTSVTVSGLNVAGTYFLGFATAETSVPGTTVTGVGVTNVTGTGLTVWATRTNSTPFFVNYLVKGDN